MPSSNANQPERRSADGLPRFSGIRAAIVATALTGAHMIYTALGGSNLFNVQSTPAAWAIRGAVDIGIATPLVAITTWILARARPD